MRATRLICAHERTDLNLTTRERKEDEKEEEGKKYSTRVAYIPFDF